MHSGLREGQTSRIGCKDIVASGWKGMDFTGVHVVVVVLSGYSSRVRRPEPSP